MLLRDLEGPVVVADVARWVLDPAAPLASGADQGAEAALLRPHAATLAQRTLTPWRRC